MSNHNSKLQSNTNNQSRELKLNNQQQHSSLEKLRQLVNNDYRMHASIPLKVIKNFGQEEVEERPKLS